jgi:cytochrome c556
MPHKPNPYDDVLQNVKDAMVQVDDHLANMAKDVRPFDSKQLTTEEDDLLFHSPSLRYMGQIEPTTGQPYTNAQATQKLLQDLGPEAYVAYVDDYVRRADRRNADVNDQLDQMEQGGMSNDATPGA